MSLLQVYIIAAVAIFAIPLLFLTVEHIVVSFTTSKQIQKKFRTMYPKLFVIQLPLVFVLTATALNVSLEYSTAMDLVVMAIKLFLCLFIVANYFGTLITFDYDFHHDQ